MSPVYLTLQPLVNITSNSRNLHLEDRFQLCNSPRAKVKKGLNPSASPLKKYSRGTTHKDYSSANESYFSLDSCRSCEEASHSCAESALEDSCSSKHSISLTSQCQHVSETVGNYEQLQGIEKDTDVDSITDEVAIAPGESSRNDATTH